MNVPPRTNEVVFGQARRIPHPADERSTLFHPLSAFLLVAIDSLWMFAEWSVLAWIVTIPLAFFTVGLSTLLIERNLNGHGWGKAVTIALFLAIVAAIPTPVLATPVGAGLLAWSGIKRLIWKKVANG